MEQKTLEVNNDAEDWGTQFETSLMELKVNNVRWLEQRIHDIQTVKKEKEKAEEQWGKMKKSNGNLKKNKGKNSGLNRKKSEEGTKGKKSNFKCKDATEKKCGLSCT